MSEKFQRGSIVINKSAEEFDSKIVVLVTGDRSKRDDHFSGVCLSTYNHRITPIGDFSDTWHLSKFEKLFNSFEEWLLSNQQAQPGAVWVKATRQNMRRSAILRDSVLPENNIHQWVINGWDEKGVKFTNRVEKEWWELEILDESGTAAGREEDAVNPVKFHLWLINNHWEEHSSGRYWHRSKNRHDWPPDETCEEDELILKFKQQKEKS